MLKCRVLESGTEKYVEDKIQEYTKNTTWPRAERVYKIDENQNIDKKYFEEKEFNHPHYFPPGQRPAGLEIPSKYDKDNVNDIVSEIGTGFFFIFEKKFGRTLIEQKTQNLTSKLALCVLFEIPIESH